MVASILATLPKAPPEPTLHDTPSAGIAATPSMALAQPRLGWGVWATLVWSLAALLTYSAMKSLVPAAWSAAQGGASSMPWAVKGMADVIGMCAAVGVLFLAASVSRAPVLAYLGLVRSCRGRAPAIIIIGLATVATPLLVNLVLGPALGFPMRWPRADSTLSAAFLGWATTTLFTPAFEEILFRGFLYRGLEQSRLGAWGAIVLTAALFALIHVQFIGESDWLLQMLRIGVMGLLLGWLRERTGSVLPGIGIHALINGVEAPVILHLAVWP